MTNTAEKKIARLNELYKNTGMPFTDLTSTNEIWYTLISNCFSDKEFLDVRILFELGAAGYANRMDWTEGYSIVEDVFYTYADQLKEIHPDIYQEYMSVLNTDEEPDGRVFRDMQHSFDILFADARTELDFVDKYDDKTRKALLKLFTPSNIKFIMNYESSNLL